MYNDSTKNIRDQNCPLGSTETKLKCYNEGLHVNSSQDKVLFK